MQRLTRTRVLARAVHSDDPDAPSPEAGSPHRISSDREVDAVLWIIASPARQRILALLRSGPLTVSDLAARLRLVMPLVSRHLADLELIGLIASRTSGRERSKHLTDRARIHIIEGGAIRFDLATLGGGRVIFTRPFEDVLSPAMDAA